MDGVRDLLQSVTLGGVTICKKNSATYFMYGQPQIRFAVSWSTDSKLLKISVTHTESVLQTPTHKHTCECVCACVCVSLHMHVHLCMLYILMCVCRPMYIHVRMHMCIVCLRVGLWTLLLWIYIQGGWIKLYGIRNRQFLSNQLRLLFEHFNIIKLSWRDV